ncbi:AAA family ATPase [Rhizobium cauense]|uniref:AAA family ATPase n=1 Tax=Rhizobium cauense TaxID=1166683 RepID=UPI001CB77237|nr:ATP-binding protein [Rhizobium cauense]
MYNEAFHTGVNVVRGDNSSGKSTIMNFIFFGLGGNLDRSAWSEHALKCDHVWLEVEFNGDPAVLRREIDVSSQSAMEIFGGRYGQALEAPIEAWHRYPYSRSTSQESFSQAIFRLLEMPDVAVEGTSNITIHQILRLLYADQLSPTASSASKGSTLKTFARRWATFFAARSTPRFTNFSNAGGQRRKNHRGKRGAAEHLQGPRRRRREYDT